MLSLIMRQGLQQYDRSVETQAALNLGLIEVEICLRAIQTVGRGGHYSHSQFAMTGPQSTDELGRPRSSAAEVTVLRKNLW